MRARAMDPLSDVLYEFPRAIVHFFENKTYSTNAKLIYFTFSLWWHDSRLMGNPVKVTAMSIGVLFCFVLFKRRCRSGFSPTVVKVHEPWPVSSWAGTITVMDVFTLFFPKKLSCHHHQVRNPISIQSTLSTLKVIFFSLGKV